MNEHSDPFEEIWPLIDGVEGLLVPNSGQERWLFETALSLPDDAIIVEVGPYKGRATTALALACRATGRRVFAIDTFCGNETNFKREKENVFWGKEGFLEDFTANLRKNDLDKYVIPLRGLSHAVAQTWAKPIDMLFIDGSHDYDDVLRDVDLLFPWLKPGGVVGLHDVTEGWPGPMRVWREHLRHMLVDLGNRHSLAFGTKPRQALEGERRDDSRHHPTQFADKKNETNLTLFSIPKPFQGPISTIQRNALKSWRLNDGVSEIVVFGDEDGLADAAKEFDLWHFAKVECNEFGTPIVGDIMLRAQNFAYTKYLCYINTDIILIDPLVRLVEKASRRFKWFIIVGRRTNLDVTEEINTSEDWRGWLRQRIQDECVLHPETGIDYIIFPRGLVQEMPPFTVGRPAWDNWLIFHMAQQRIPIIDATPVMTVVHQNHGYGHVKEGTGVAWMGPEADENSRLALATNPHFLPQNFTIGNATHVITPKGVRSDYSRARVRRRVSAWISLRPRLDQTRKRVLALFRRIRGQIRMRAHRIGGRYRKLREALRRLPARAKGLFANWSISGPKGVFQALKNKGVVLLKWMLGPAWMWAKHHRRFCYPVLPRGLREVLEYAEVRQELGDSRSYFTLVRSFCRDTVLPRDGQFVFDKYRRNTGHRMEMIGTHYGGWCVPVDMIDEDWICYCVGAGEDISFDLGLIERFGCRVFAFDPTPRALAHFESTKRAVEEGRSAPINNNPEQCYQASSDKFSRMAFYPVGLWKKAKRMKFYAPQDPSHVSHSILNLQKTDRYLVADCKPLDVLMRELGHSRIDLLKLDIEGAEHAVARSIIKNGNIRPKLLAHVFDQPATLYRMADTMLRLTEAGYVPVDLNGWDMTFLRQDVVRAEQPEDISAAVRLHA